MNASFVHFEFHADAATRAFYEKSFGWQFRDMNLPGVGLYTMAITTDVDKQGMPKSVGAINGAVLPPLPGKQAPNTVPVLQVQDAHLAFNEAVKNGATVLSKPTELGPMGLYCRVADPMGNVIGIWQPLVEL